jgi:hypothetical protein
MNRKRIHPIDEITTPREGKKLKYELIWAQRRHMIHWLADSG